MIRAVAYRLQESAHGGASKVTQRRLMTLTAEFETGGTIAPRSIGMTSFLAFTACAMVRTVLASCRET